MTDRAQGENIGTHKALYLEWRPKRFSEIVGREQEHIITTLKNQIINNRVAHAYLFCGSRGTGKTTTARIFARAINCLSPVDGYEPCGNCAICREFYEERSMDLMEIDAASNNSVDEIRDLCDKIKYPPANAKRKVYIIDEVHMLSSGAFNALLKTLEEPPEHAVFILATTEPNKLLPTVLSRCQRFDFKRYTVDTIVDQMRKVLKDIGAEDEALYEIARSAEGGMRDALSILDMCLSYDNSKVSIETVREVIGTSGRDFLFAFTDCLLRGDSAKAFQFIDKMMRDGRDAKIFGREVTDHLRALLVTQALGQNKEQEAASILECTIEDARRYIKQGKNLPTEKLTRMMESFMEYESDTKWAQPRIALELCTFRCCRPPQQLQLDALAERVAQLEKNIKEGVRIAPATEADLSEPPAADAQDDADLPVPPPADAQDDTNLPVPPIDAHIDSAMAPRVEPMHTDREKIVYSRREPDRDFPAEAPARADASKPAAKKGKPAPKPEASALIDGQEEWNAAVSALSVCNPPIPGLLKAVYAGMDGDVVNLEFSKNDSIVFMKLLESNEGKKKKIIEDKLSELFGKSIKVVLRIQGEGPKPKNADPERTDTIEQVRVAFGRENVDFMD